MTHERCPLVVALLLGLAVVAAPHRTRGAEPPFVPFLGAYIHLPSLWGDATDLATREQAIAQHLDRFRDAGLRVVLPYVVRTDGKASYPSPLFAEREYGDWDPLAVILREARQRHLQVYPVVCVLACGHKQPQGILKQHPEWAVRDKAGQPLGFISPGHPEARQWVVAVLQELVSRYQPDGVLLDYLRFPDSSAALDAVAQAQFDASHPAEQFPREGEEYRGELLTFKRQCLTELAGQISDALRAQEPRPRIAVYMWGAQELKGTRDWRTWAERGYVDMFNLTGYAYRNQYGDDYLNVVEKRFREVAAVLAELPKPVDLTICVGIQTSHGKIEAAQDIKGYLDVAQRCGVQGATIFTWQSLQRYLAEVQQAGYLEQFAKELHPATPGNLRAQPD